MHSSTLCRSLCCSSALPVPGSSRRRCGVRGRGKAEAGAARPASSLPLRFPLTSAPASRAASALFLRLFWCAAVAPVRHQRTMANFDNAMSNCGSRGAKRPSNFQTNGKLPSPKEVKASSLPKAASANATSRINPDSETPLFPEPGKGPRPGGYQVPLRELKDIVDAPPTPALSFSPKRNIILFLQRRSLPPLADLARPELKLGGLRIDPVNNTRSRMSYYTGITIHDLLDDGTLGPERSVSGLPIDPKINYVSWSPDGAHLAFTVRADEEEEGALTGLELWVANVGTAQARKLIGPPDMILNPIFDTFSWLDDSTLVALIVPPSRGPVPKKPLVPYGPGIQSNELELVVQNRTYQDLLKDPHDEDLFEHYGTSNMILVSLDSEVTLIGKPALYTSIDPSPNGEYMLVASTHKPYSYIVPSGRFPKKTDLWKRDGEFVREVSDLPLAESIPIAFNSVRVGKRSINWRADHPCSLYWVETQDKGDAKIEVSPRDIVFTQSAKAAHEDKPEVFFQLNLRYGGVAWGDDSLALVYESWYKTRHTRTWAMSPGNPGAEGRKLFDRSTEDVYSDPGSPMMRRTAWGTYVLAQLNCSAGKTSLLLNGSGATPEGNIPFLDVFDIETGKKERIWESAKEQYFETVVALMSDQKDENLNLDELRILVSKESQTDPPQYYLRSWPDQKVSQITTFPHPYPQLANLKKEIIRYPRSDGVQLTANLYLPPNYDPENDGPLPTLLWAYPREFKNKDNAGQMRGSRYSFAGIGSTSPLLWLARRFAILDGPTMPIIGEGEEEANDRYVEQLVSSAEAAVEEVVRRGVKFDPSKMQHDPMAILSVQNEVSDRSKIAVGGHSYGAFMTANLLAHAPNLFCCGIARAGAYNRTLTPFGFQFAVDSHLPTGKVDISAGEVCGQGLRPDISRSVQTGCGNLNLKRPVGKPDLETSASGNPAWSPSQIIIQQAAGNHDFILHLCYDGSVTFDLVKFLQEIRESYSLENVFIQAEERTLWEAPKTYIEMSPFMLAHKIKKPILLIHGEEDNNPGTLTMQSDRFYNALKGHGALTRLVLLPFESHGYQGRESVMHCLWEMDRWLQTYCIDAGGGESREK